jgi:hypothetical protein
MPSLGLAARHWASVSIVKSPVRPQGFIVYTFINLAQDPYTRPYPLAQRYKVSLHATIEMKKPRIHGALRRFQ